ELELHLFLPVACFLRLQDAGRHGCCIPDAGRIVETAGDEAMPVGAEPQRDHAGVVTAEGEDLAAGGRVPELDRAVIARRGDPASVRTESDPDHVRGMAHQRVEETARRYVQDLHRTECIRLAALLIAFRTHGDT